MKREFASPLCPWYLRDYGRLFDQRAAAPSVAIVKTALSRVFSRDCLGVAVLLPERFRVNCAFGGGHVELYWHALSRNGSRNYTEEASVQPAPANGG